MMPWLSNGKLQRWVEREQVLQVPGRFPYATVQSQGNKGWCL